LRSYAVFGPFGGFYERVNIPDLVKKNESQENLFKRVNQHLKAKATSRFGSETQRWYYLYVPDDRDEGVRKLAELLPELRICGLTREAAIENEDELVELLTQFYARKRKRMANP
jgi:hypothetical protein